VARPWMFSIMVLVACSGGDDAAPVAAEPTCEGLTTDGYGLVSVENWPAGTDAALSTFETLEGRFRVADSCQPGVPTYVKIVLKAGNPFNRQEAQLVTSPYVDAPCGCTDDPALGADTDYDMVGTYITPTPQAGASFFMEDPWFLTAVTGPGAQVTAYTPYTFFDPASGLVARSCTTYNIEPYQSAEYTEMDLYVRVEPGPLLGATYVLYTAEGSQQCELTDFVRDGA